MNEEGLIHFYVTYENFTNLKLGERGIGFTTIKGTKKISVSLPVSKVSLVETQGDDCIVYFL